MQADPRKVLVIATCNAGLSSAGLPTYMELVQLLRAAENKFAAMQQYHAGPSHNAIGAMREKITGALDQIP